MSSPTRELVFSRSRIQQGLVLVSVFAATAAIMLTASRSSACPFCSNMGKTLAENVDEAQVVLYGTLFDAKLNPEAKPGEPDGSTTLDVITVIKDHPIVQGKKQIVLPRYLPAAQTDKVEYIIFAEVVDGRVDPYRGMPVDSKEFVDYLAGAVKMAKAPAAEKLAFFFKYLDTEDINISGDAYKEFANAPYATVQAAAKAYDPDKLIAWIHDPKTPSYRIGLYGCLLGVTGRAQDAEVLRKIIDSPDSRPLTGVDGIMGGYCVLDPKNGPNYVLGLLADPGKDFNLQYAALRTVRFLLTDVPTVDKKEVFTKLQKALAIPDIADLIIDEFRKNKVWDPADQILALYGNPKFDIQVIRRAIIRYALKCPSPKAKDFVTNLRKKDPQLVADVEEILKFEEAQYGQPAAQTAKSTPNS
ncbi:MAG: hypothetical protein U1D30_17620 [Planctomycetota bacterium]